MQPGNKDRPFVATVDLDIYDKLNGLFVGHNINGTKLYTQGASPMQAWSAM